MSRRRIWVYVVLVLLLVGVGTFTLMKQATFNLVQRGEGHVVSIQSPSVPNTPPVLHATSPVPSANQATPLVPVSNFARIANTKIPSNQLASFRPSQTTANQNRTANQLPAVSRQPTVKPKVSPRPYGSPSSSPLVQRSNPFQSNSRPTRHPNSFGSISGVKKPIANLGFATSGGAVRSPVVPTTNTPPSRLNQTTGFQTGAVTSKLVKRASQAPPTILAHAVQGLPSSAGQVQALIRATYNVPEEHTDALIKLFAIADVDIEATVEEKELTITAGEEAHSAVSRFVSTFLQGEKSTPYVSPDQNQETSVRVSGNRMRVVRQTSYEEKFEPESFGFSNSAKDVKILLRANYDLKEGQADALASLLECETKLVVETKCSVNNIEPAGTDEGADETLESEESDELDEDAESEKKSDKPAGDALNEKASKEKGVTKNVCVTTTKLGQIAVAQLVNAMFETENEKKASAATSQFKPKPQNASGAFNSRAPAQVQGIGSRAN